MTTRGRNGKMSREFIVVEKHTKNGPSFERDEILMKIETLDGFVWSTGLNGTISSNKGEVTFGPNCPNGVAVYKRV